jgi:hypothetical protein
VAPAGGPVDDEEPSGPAARGLLAPAVPREHLARQAAALRADGWTWQAIGTALHVATSTAWYLARPAR